MKYSELVEVKPLLVSRAQANAMVHSAPLMARLVHFAWVRRIEPGGVELFRVEDIQKALDRMRREALPQLPKKG